MLTPGKFENKELEHMFEEDDMDVAIDSELSFSEQSLNLPTFAFRRQRGDLIELYKHFHHYDKETISPAFQPRERVTRKHAFQLLERKAKDGSQGIQSISFY